MPDDEDEDVAPSECLERPAARVLLNEYRRDSGVVDYGVSKKCRTVGKRSHVDTW
jgi:hypothetical protein